MENEIRHYVVCWKQLKHKKLRFQRFDTRELAEERYYELTPNVFVSFASVEAMTEEQYAGFLRSNELWENN